MKISFIWISSNLPGATPTLLRGTYMNSLSRYSSKGLLSLLGLYVVIMAYYLFCTKISLANIAMAFRFISLPSIILMRFSGHSLSIVCIHTGTPYNVMDCATEAYIRLGHAFLTLVALSWLVLNHFFNSSSYVLANVMFLSKWIPRWCGLQRYFTLDGDVPQSLLYFLCGASFSPFPLYNII